ncbi:flagellar basal-body MS-ring/collar protein FliF [Buchnera aphidicola]|uniref:flagellar basal-body MS-ring/collar protein FliF n=1 Tax=Buchnera aphidicola TaxID=9 RepID=UPI00107D8998|nr:flagellar basal-body MS-ring/collar protein FliF [Buchnera aphidicola]VFP79058.1 Flagellar M-ring protein [Buchnera aphidicola (Cinara curtihirsuta)]
MDIINMFFLNIKKKWNDFLIYIFNQIKFVFFILFFVFFISFSFFLWSKQVNYVVLYTNLSDADSRWVISKLKNMHISYRFCNFSRTLLVPENKLNEIRFSLINNNILKKNYGFELLDKEKLGTSQFREHINYHRGLEGELSKTLEHIFPIQHARVHLVCKKDTDFFRDEQTPSASIIVTLLPNTSLKKEQIDSIILLISGSVPDLSPDNIVLVNHLGNILNKFDLNNTKFFNDNRYRNINILEEYYCDCISKILIPIYGLKNFVVHVKVNKNNKNIFVNKPKKQKIHLINPKSQQSINNILDIFSSKSNYFFSFKNKILDSNTVFTNNNISLLGFKESDIKNLTVTILINYKENSSGILSPLSKKELQDIENTIKLVIDFSSKRGDHIHIMNYLFSDSSSTIFFNKNSVYNNFNQYYKIYIFFGILIIFLFFYFLFMKGKLINKKKFFLNSKDNLNKHKTSNSIGHINKSDLDKIDNVNKNDFFIKKDFLQKNPKIIEQVIRYWIKKK